MKKIFYIILTFVIILGPVFWSIYKDYTNTQSINSWRESRNEQIEAYIKEHPSKNATIQNHISKILDDIHRFEKRAELAGKKSDNSEYLSTDGKSRVDALSLLFQTITEDEARQKLEIAQSFSRDIQAIVDRTNWSTFVFRNGTMKNDVDYNLESIKRMLKSAQDSYAVGSFDDAYGSATEVESYAKSLHKSLYGLNPLGRESIQKDYLNKSETVLGKIEEYMHDSKNTIHKGDTVRQFLLSNKADFQKIKSDLEQSDLERYNSNKDRYGGLRLMTENVYIHFFGIYEQVTGLSDFMSDFREKECTGSAFNYVRGWNDYQNQLIDSNSIDDFGCVFYDGSIRLFSEWLKTKNLSLPFTINPLPIP